MAVENTYPVRVNDPNRVLIIGEFVTVGSGNPTTVNGDGFTVTRAGAGDYDIALDNAVNEIEAVFLSVAPKTAAPTQHTVVVEDVDARTTSNVSLHVEASADVSTTDLALADDAGTKVSFMIVARNTNVA